MIDGIDSVENVAVTVLNTPVIVLLAIALMVLAIGIFALLWAVGKTLKSQSTNCASLHPRAHYQSN